MRDHRTIVFAAISILAVSACSMLQETEVTRIDEAKEQYQYPSSNRSDFIEELHGQKIPDPYRWLENDDSQETNKWLRQQEAFINSNFDDSKYAKDFAKTLKEHFYLDKRTPPTVIGEKSFYFKKEKSTGLMTFLMDGDSEEGKVLVRADDFKEGEIAEFSIRTISDSGRFLVVAYRFDGADEVNARIKDVEQDKYLDETLPLGLYHSFSFRADSSGFYYTQRSRTRASIIKFHSLNTPFNNDYSVVKKEFDKQEWVYVVKETKDKKVLIQSWVGWDTNTLYLADLATGKVTTLTPANSFSYLLDGHIENNYVLAREGNGRSNIWSFKAEKPMRSEWSLIVKGDDNLQIEDFFLTKDYILIHYLNNVQSELVQYNLQGDELQKINIDSHASIRSITTNMNDNSVFVSTESITSPTKITLHNLDAKTREIFHSANVSFNPLDYETVQKWYESKDGTNIPMYITYKKGTKLDGSNPTILYGYGGFNRSILPVFSATTAAWLSQGGVWAVANIRGGGEFGEKWHHNGRLDKKQNVFDDFIAASEYLIKMKYTKTKHLGIMGGSNGGLLVAAVATQRPELFKAVVCRYPDLDMIGYHRFPNNNRSALLEYGDASIKEQFDYLIKYSPYQAVKKGVKYPAMYFVTGGKDTRVPPLQTRKMVAKMQWATSSKEPIFLRYDATSGHVSEKSNPTRQIDANVERLNFLANQLGL